MRSNTSFKSNTDFWVKKITGNQERDKIHTKKLKSAGWTVLRFWSSDVENKLSEVVATIDNKIKKLR